MESGFVEIRKGSWRLLGGLDLGINPRLAPFITTAGALCIGQGCRVGTYLHTAASRPARQRFQEIHGVHKLITGVTTTFRFARIAFLQINQLLVTLFSSAELRPCRLPSELAQGMFYS